MREFNPLPASARLKRADRAARSKEGEGAAVQYDIPTGPAFEPTCVYRMLSVIRTDTMVEGRQEDAEEFLSCLLNGLNDEMLEVMKATAELPNGDLCATPSPVPVSSNGETDDVIQGEDGDEWKVSEVMLQISTGLEVSYSSISIYFCMLQVMGPKNKGSVTRRADFGRTPLSDIFRGHLRSRVYRTINAHDNHVTDNVQPFFTLQLDIEVSATAI